VFLQQLIYGKRYAAIEHAENSTFNYLELTKKKNEFIISKKNQITKFENITEELKGQKHFFLVINNEQVLFKKVTVSNTKPSLILRTAFPNIISSDFYFEVHSTDTASFIAIARKEIVDTLILKYQKAGIAVIDFSLGNIVVKNLQTFVGNESIHSSNAKIDFEAVTISEIKKGEISNEVYNINDLKVSNTEVLPLAGIIGYYSKNPSSSISKKLKQRYLQKRFFDVGLKTGLGFLLAILLINFLFFSSYREKVGNLTGELQVSETYKNQLNKLQKEVSQKKRLVKSVNSASNSKVSKYIDELGVSTPNTILLSQMSYQPKKGVVRADKQIIFDPNKILVKGTSKENENFSNWISVLEKKEWIKNISILEYGKGKKTSSISNFEFIITNND
jgi:hypothetical protein